MNGLDLFSGIGGISLALDPWVRTVAYCENDRFAQAVLLSRMSDRTLHFAPIWDDVRTLGADQFSVPIDIISGGFPCQDISSAGRGAGLAGERSGLFFEIIRLVDELRPQFVFLENVAAITFRGLDRVISEFTAIGYDCRWTIISASELGACHLRKRWFLLAYSARERFAKAGEFRCDEPAQRPTCGSENAAHANGHALRLQSVRLSECSSQDVAGHDGVSPSDSDADGPGLEGIWRRSELSRPAVYNGWVSQPTIRGGNNGIQNRVDRLRCLGNSVVPAQAREAFERLSGMRHSTFRADTRRF